MITTGLRELRQQASELVRRAEAGETIVVTVNGSPVDVFGTFVEQPPQQPNGGGLNTSLAVGSVNLDTPIEDGASVNVQFLLGIMQTGGYRFYVNIEMLNDGEPGLPATPLKRKKLEAMQTDSRQQRPRAKQ